MPVPLDSLGPSTPVARQADGRDAGDSPGGRVDIYLENAALRVANAGLLASVARKDELISELYGRLRATGEWAK